MDKTETQRGVYCELKTTDRRHPSRRHITAKWLTLDEVAGLIETAEKAKAELVAQALNDQQ